MYDIGVYDSDDDQNVIYLFISISHNLWIMDHHVFNLIG